MNKFKTKFDEKIVVRAISYEEANNFDLIFKINTFCYYNNNITDNFYFYYLHDTNTKWDYLFLILEINNFKFLCKIKNQDHNFYYKNIQILSEIDIHENEYYDLLSGAQILC